MAEWCYTKLVTTSYEEFDMWKRILNAFEKAQMKRVAYWQLQNLTDRELKDIGISRGDIRRLAYEL